MAECYLFNIQQDTFSPSASPLLSAPSYSANIHAQGRAEVAPFPVGSCLLSERPRKYKHTHTDTHRHTQTQTHTSFVFQIVWR